MKCPSNYADLACGATGVGFLHRGVEIGDTTLPLVSSNAEQFPTLKIGESFFISISDACTKMCERVRVVAVNKETDTLTLANGVTACYASLSRVAYEIMTVEAVRMIAQSVGVNVVAPLVYDCETHTLSIDCQGLRNLIANCEG